MTILKWPRRWFERYARSTARRADDAAVVLRVGRRDGDDRTTWLVRDARPWSADHSGNDPATQWIVGVRHDAPGSMDEIPAFASGRLDFGQGPWSDHAWGSIRHQGRIVPLDVLDLIGPGLHRVRLTGDQPSAATALDEAVGDDGRHSRTIGALGGAAVRRRVIERKIGLVGCGRTGSLVATNLARIGALDLVLIDPDRVEPHNVGEMDGVRPGDVGRLKVDAVGDEIQRIAGLPPARLARLAEPVERGSARRLLAECDIVISAVDRDAPRLVAAWTAVYHHQVLLDLATGVHRRETGRAPGRPYPRRMGADVRLILPGDGCLMCRGGLVDERDAFETLTSRPEPTAAARAPWALDRAGSLRPLNQMAAGMGTALLLDLAAERVTDSRWLQLSLDDQGRPSLAADRRDSPEPCPLCARAGRGDMPITFGEKKGGDPLLAT